MTYKTILVHVTGEPEFQTVMAPAFDLARRCGAHLIGLAVVPPYILQPSFVPGATSSVVEEHRKVFIAVAQRLKAAFETSAREAGISAEWVDDDAGLLPVWRSAVNYGRAADLIISGISDDEGTEQLVLQSGRPVLFVPAGCDVGGVGKRITAAWNGRREGTRAVFDALPLLKQADAVNVVWVNPKDDSATVDDVPTGDLCTALARHGIKCEAVELSAPDAAVGDALADYMQAWGSDLLVMGCYGHSRFREFVLGGATRKVLRTTVLPVLMSH